MIIVYFTYLNVVLVPDGSVTCWSKIISSIFTNKQTLRFYKVLSAEEPSQYINNATESN